MYQVHNYLQRKESAIRRFPKSIPIFLIFEENDICKYSDLPNNRAADLIIFWGKNTYTTLLEPTRLLISDIFPSKPDFHLHK